MLRNIIFTLFFLVNVMVCWSGGDGGGHSRIKSYDTTYVDIRDTSLLHRQIYINDVYGRKEVYILYDIRRDSVIKQYRWEDKY